MSSRKLARYGIWSRKLARYRIYARIRILIQHQSVIQRDNSTKPVWDHAPYFQICVGKWLGNCTKFAGNGAFFKFCRKTKNKSTTWNHFETNRPHGTIEATEVLGRWEKKKKKRLPWGEALEPARAGRAVLKFESGHGPDSAWAKNSPFDFSRKKQKECCQFPCCNDSKWSLWVHYASTPIFIPLHQCITENCIMKVKFSRIFYALFSRFSRFNNPTGIPDSNLLTLNWAAEYS
jgi:hypothetical protein